MTKKPRTSKATDDFSTDRPISSARHDKLSRNPFAESLAQRIGAWRGKDSLVIALCGEWGCGKTSLKNLVVEILAKKSRSKVDLLEFSPWELSGRESVAAAFFSELALVLKSGDTESKERIEKLNAYAKMAIFGGVAAKWIGRAMSASGRPEGLIVETTGEMATQSAEVFDTASNSENARAKIKEQSLASLKKSLADEMLELKKPILVVIDDIDRLTSDEIREIFQLVKANADFPNLIFLLLFDRSIVAEALSAVSGGRGGEFLDKIVQVLFHVPQAPRKDIHRALFAGLDRWIDQAEVGERWERSRWNRVWANGLGEYFGNLRSVYRFLSSFGFQVTQMRNGETFELNPLDLVILETFRLFESDFYESIPSNRTFFLGDWRAEAFDKNEAGIERAKELDRIISVVPQSRQKRVREITKLLFPGAFGHVHPEGDEMLRNLRAAHEAIFERYFVLGLPEDDVSQVDIDALLENIGHTEEFSRICDSLKKRGKIEAAFERLDVYKSTIPLSVFPNLITSLGNVGDQLPESVHRPFELSDPLTYAWRLIYFGLRQIRDEKQRYDLLRQGIEASRGVRLTVELVAREARRKERNDFDYLVSEEDQLELQPLALDRLRLAASEGRLRSMSGLTFMLYRWRDWGGDKEVREWIDSQIKSDQDALWFLGLLLSTMSSTSNKTVYIRRISLDAVTSFCDVTVLERLTRPLELKSLNLDKMRALRAFRFAMQWKAEGRPDGYYGDSEVTSPLAEER